MNAAGPKTTRASIGSAIVAVQCAARGLAGPGLYADPNAMREMRLIEAAGRLLKAADHVSSKGADNAVMLLKLVQADVDKTLAELVPVRR